MNTKQRMEIEEKIVRKFFETVIAAGYSVVVDDGEERTGRMNDVDKLMVASFSVDEESFLVYDDDKYLGTVFVVYGNDGWDVIADYSMRIEALVHPAYELANELEEQYSRKYMYWAQFYQDSTGYVPGSIPPRFDPAYVTTIEVCGDRGVLILDGRLSPQNMGIIAARECQKRGFTYWRIFKGEGFNGPHKPVSGLWPVVYKPDNTAASATYGA